MAAGLEAFGDGSGVSGKEAFLRLSSTQIYDYLVVKLIIWLRPARSPISEIEIVGTGRKWYFGVVIRNKCKRKRTRSLTVSMGLRAASRKNEVTTASTGPPSMLRCASEKSPGKTSKRNSSSSTTDAVSTSGKAMGVVTSEEVRQFTMLLTQG